MYSENNRRGDEVFSSLILFLIAEKGRKKSQSILAERRKKGKAILLLS